MFSTFLSSRLPLAGRVTNGFQESNDGDQAVTYYCTAKTAQSYALFGYGSRLFFLAHKNFADYLTLEGSALVRLVLNFSMESYNPKAFTLPFFWRKCGV
ncbi:MAG TPA: hypothetical protein VNH19_20810 [Candidatus Limnocylindrales bacterium]|nr:hypothetical protein [Candidatus Limnocylindrales bacterium]